MTEIVHAVTGEILEYQPVSPIEVEYIIRELGDRLERAAPILDKLQRARYDAETEYSKAFETAKLMSKREMYSDRRSEAKLACLPQEQALNEAKAQLHHAERLQDALGRKLSGYQTIKKGLEAAYSAGGVGR